MLMVKVRADGKKSYLFGGRVRLEDMVDEQQTFTKRCNAFFFCRADFPTDKKTVLNARHEGRTYAAMTCRNHGDKNGQCQPCDVGQLTVDPNAFFGGVGAVMCLLFVLLEVKYMCSA